MVLARRVRPGAAQRYEYSANDGASTCGVGLNRVPGQIPTLNFANSRCARRDTGKWIIHRALLTECRYRRVPGAPGLAGFARPGRAASKYCHRQAFSHYFLFMPEGLHRCRPRYGDSGCGLVRSLQGSGGSGGATAPRSRKDGETWGTLTLGHADVGHTDLA